jgi:hypothetical protein
MKHGMPMGVALIVGLMLCSTVPARGEGPCVDKIVQTIGQCTGCYLCDTSTPNGYCACEWLYNCTPQCDMMFFVNPGCPDWGCGTGPSAGLVSRVGYPRACRVLPSPTRQSGDRAQQGKGVSG